MDMTLILESLSPVLIGLGAGIATGITVYFKQRMATKNMKFDKVKLFNTAVYGGIIGVVAAVQGVPLESAAEFVFGPLAPVLATIGLVHVTQNTKRGLVDAVKNKIKK